MFFSLTTCVLSHIFDNPKAYDAFRWKKALNIQDDYNFLKITVNIISLKDYV